MSSIYNTFPATNPYQAMNLNAFTQFVNDFNAIGSALQSGNLADAQSTLAEFQQDLPGQSQTPNQPFGNDTQANTDYQKLAGALNAGNLAVARQAYAGLQNDLQGTGKSHRHHPCGADDETVATSAPSGSPDTLLYAAA
ncbi:MAG: hypothetical protein ABSA83_22825 [Verrucomicrobiota bacterium]|jgi:hypothetical protein